MGSTFGRTFTTHFAGFDVDVSQVVFYPDGVVRTYLEAFGTTGARHCTIFPGNTALVPVHARYINFAVFSVFMTQFDDGTRTGFYTRAASRATGIVYYRQSGCRIHRQSIELTGYSAVAAPQTTICAVGIAGVQAMLYGARRRPIV